MAIDQTWQQRLGTWSILVLMMIGLTLREQCRAQENTAKGPFPPGETLVYDVQWVPPSWMFFFPVIGAGEITLIFQGPTQHQGTPAFKLTADAVSSGLFPRIG